MRWRARSTTTSTVSSAATKILHKRNVFIAPDVVANAGGVIVSYFEWVQDIMSFFWDEQDIDNKLKGVILKAFDNVYHFKTEKAIQSNGTFCKP